MNSASQSLETLQDIRKMMEKSSRFISLSGWSGISAGICALVGAWLASGKIDTYYKVDYNTAGGCPSCLRQELITIAAGVFVAAFLSAAFFTFIKSKKEGVAIWG